ncbi:MAG: hypothetical protein IJD82_00010 [Clostridia bacterium]|nr:hypothetical protein [Clostridia bacterium]
MKRALYLLLALACLLTALCGCNKEDTFLPTGTDPIESYDSEQKFTPNTGKPAEGSDSADTDAQKDAFENINETSEITEIVGEFTVRHKKYTYEGNNLVVLYFENGTNANYTVTIDGTYKDADGNAITTESQTYKDVAAGTSAYFVFRPNMVFDSFAYEVSSELYDGICYRSNLVPVDYSSELDIKLQYWYGPFVDEADGKLYDTHQLCSGMQYLHNNDVNTYSDFVMVVFDSKDQIIYLEERKYDFAMSKGTDEDQYWSQDFQLYASHETAFNLDRETWPEYLKGGFYGIMAVKTVRTKEETPEQYWHPEDRRAKQ